MIITATRLLYDSLTVQTGKMDPLMSTALTLPLLRDYQEAYAGGGSLPGNHEGAPAEDTSDGAGRARKAVALVMLLSGSDTAVPSVM